MDVQADLQDMFAGSSTNIMSGWRSSSSSEDSVIVAVAALLGAAANARTQVQSFIALGRAGDRLVDCLFLDMAMQQAGRACLEAHLQELRAEARTCSAEQLSRLLVPAVELAAGAVDGNSELLLCLKQLTELMGSTRRAGAEYGHGSGSDYSNGNGDYSGYGGYTGSSVYAEDGFGSAYNSNGSDGAYSNGNGSGSGSLSESALQLRSVCDRVGRVLARQSSRQIASWQPTADALGSRLPGVDLAYVEIFAEGVARGTFPATLSQLLGVVAPRIRELSGAGKWDIVSRGPQEPVSGVIKVGCRI
jgi:hypothetical protein